MDRIVQMYVETDMSFARILAGVQVPRSPILEAMRHLRELIDGRQSTRESLQLAERVHPSGTDGDLFVLFLGNWSEACLVKGRMAEAAAIVHRAQALCSRHTPCEVAAYVSTIEAQIAGLSGNHAKQESILRGVIRRLPSDSPRRRFHVLELAFLLAHAGRLVELAAELDRVSGQSGENFRRGWIAAARFVNACETGNSEQAIREIPEIESYDRDRYFAQDYANYTLLLDFMAVRGIDRVSDRPGQPNWAMVVQCLLADLPEQALRWARVAAQTALGTTVSHGFMSYNLVRAELAAGHADAARRLLTMRRMRGNTHYLDDLFGTRIELLSGNTEAATTRFARLLHSIDRYEAGARLDFELRLAPELARDRLVRVTRAALGVAARDAKSESTGTAPHRIDPAPPETRRGTDRLIGPSPALALVRETIHRIADSRIPVLITGETGTGKELAAHALHETGSRAEAPFLAINCGAVAESLLESELFGHEKGSFSGATRARKGLFEEAGEGTLLLDEIGEISPRLQVALLRVLETGEIRPVGHSRQRAIRCRILACTNAELEGHVVAGRFRKDLLYRLRRLDIHIRPLRERPSDILPLCSYFLDLGRPEGTHAVVSDRLAAALRARSWPGNVRELRSTIERMRLMNSDKLYYDLADLDPQPTGLDPAPRDIAPLTAVERTASVSAAHVAAPAVMFGRSRIRRLERVLELFARHRRLTRAEIVATMAVSPNTVTKDLQALCREGRIRKVQPSASPRSAYFVSAGQEDT